MNRGIGYSIEIIVERDGKEYHAYCPALKGLHASGESKDEAINNAFELAKLYLISLMKHDEPIPVGITIGNTKHKEYRVLHKSDVDYIVKDFALTPV